MRSSGGGGNKRKSGYGTIPWSVRTRQRVGLSFFLVIMFFVLFGTIIFTEVFFPGEKGRGMVNFNRQGYNHRDYEDAIPIQNEDYISVGGEISALDETVAALLSGQRNFIARPVQKEDNKLEPPKTHILSEAQLPQYPYNLTPTEGEWQTVNGTRSKFFVYAAYVERRNPYRGVRVIAATKTRSPDRVWCRLWYRTGEEDSSSAYISKTIPARSKAIRENWNMMYSAYYVLCPLTNQTFPTFVSIVTKVLNPPSNLLTVMDNFNATVPYRFTACVKPLHFYYNQYLDLLEFFELSLLLGVTHFTLYNHTTGPQASCVLRHYIDRGMVTLLPWQLDLISQKEIRTEGIFASLNDCLYRYMYKAAYTLFIDLDEFIVPRQLETVPELIEYWNAKLRTRNIGTFEFQNAFFYRDFESDDYVDTLTDPVAANLVSVSKTRRKSRLHPFNQRSKYLVRPERVFEVGNHFIWETVSGYETYNVPSSSAILNHYRRCEIEGEDCTKTSSVVDRTAHKYKEKLTMRVRRQFDQLKDECGLSLPTFPNRKAPKPAGARSDGR